MGKPRFYLVFSNFTQSAFYRGKNSGANPGPNRVLRDQHKLSPSQRGYDFLQLWIQSSISLELIRFYIAKKSNFVSIILPGYATDYSECEGLLYSRVVAQYLLHAKFPITRCRCTNSNK